jgi:hypothetical protein
MQQNGHYLAPLPGSGNQDNIYFIQIIVNAVQYAIQLNTFEVPTDAPPGYQWGTDINGTQIQPPVEVFNPVVAMQLGTIVGSPNVQPVQVDYNVGSNPTNNVGGNAINSQFNLIIGYPVNFISDYDPNNLNPTNVSLTQAKSNALGTISYLSSQAPELQPNGNVVLTLNLVNSPYSVPTGIVYSFANTALPGEVLQSIPPNFVWCKLNPANTSQLQLSILNSSYNPLQILDPSMTFTFAVITMDEMMRTASK